jgi:Glycosyltransferases, probably involved in cell wall biogenesis
MTMPKQPFISIVMPLYNKEAEVERAIQSVFAQSFRDYELIIVDDGSTDRGPSVVATIDDYRIRMICQENAGVSAARNRGIEEARADLVAFLDADDEWKPDFLETILRLREKFPTCKVFGTPYFFCSPDGRQRPAIIRGLPAGFRDGVLVDYFDIASRSDPPLWTSATAVDKEAIKELGGFPVGIASGEDLLTWAKLAFRYEIAYCREPKARFWAPVRIKDRPGREPQFPDIVGNELARLVAVNDHIKTQGLRSYVAHWHEMRAVIFLRLNNNKQALVEIRKVADIVGMNSKLHLLTALARLPGTLPERTFRLLASVKDRYRRLRESS